MTDEELVKRLRAVEWSVNGQPCAEGNVDETCAHEAADRIEALINLNEALVELMDDRDAKLAKAVEALRLIEADCEADYPPSHLAIKYAARATLAEIEGEKK